MLVAEVIVGELARRLGLRTPRLVALDLDPEIARYEADEEVQDLLNASVGLNLGIDFLPGSFGVRRRRSPRADDGARRVLWLDAFSANVDRSWRNPNLLVWHGDLWVIDHGASLYFHHAWAGGRDRPRAVRRAAVGRRPTTCFEPRADRPAREVDARDRAPCSTRRSFADVARRRCPTTGSSRCPAPRRPTRCARRTSTS